MKARLIIYIIVAGILAAYYNEVCAIRHTNIPNALPAPRPTEQLVPEKADTSFYKWDSKEIVKAFVDNGLEVEDIKPGYIISPLTAQEATIFLIPSFGKNVGGYVSSYNSRDELNASKEFYLQMNKNLASPAWWIFEKDNILVLISGKAPEEKAKQYEKMLNEMGK